MLSVVMPYKLFCEMENTLKLWSELDLMINSILTGERVVTGVDVNEHIWEGKIVDNEMMSGFGVKVPGTWKDIL